MLEARPYMPVAIYNFGFTGGAPSPEDVRSGRFRSAELPRDAPALIFWAEIFGVEAGDELRLRLITPDGTVLAGHTRTLEKRQGRRFEYAGKRRRGGPWRAGRYHGEASLARKKDAQGRGEDAPRHGEPRARTASV